MTRSLVTGGLGFIGSALVRRLAARGHDVRVLDSAIRGDIGRLGDIEKDVDVRRGDVRDPAAVGNACAGVDVVWHLAAINGTGNFYRQPQLVLDVGVRGTLTVLDAIREHEIERVLLASSSEVYASPPTIPTDETAPLTVPDPLNPRYSYAGSKIIGELLALHMDGPSRVIVCRPHNVYGPDMGWDHVIPQLALRIRDLVRAAPGATQVPVEGSGAQTRAFCFVDDAVDGIVLAMERGAHRGIYNVGTEVETRITDLAAMIGRWYGRPVGVLPGPPKVGAPLRRCPDVSRLRGLGYAPRIDLGAGLERTLPWYDAHAGGRPRAALMS